MIRVLFIFAILTASIAGVVYWTERSGDQHDRDFDPRVAHPAYASSHPRVYFDSSHWESRLYEPFVDLIRNDGYEVDKKKGLLTRAALDRFSVLVLANEIGFRGNSKQIPGYRHNFMGDAFTDDECRAIETWVREGGSLLLASDYAPTSKNAVKLARIFGVEMVDGYVAEPQNHDLESRKWTFIVFTLENRELIEDPITRGRDASESIRKVRTFAGQALRYPQAARPFLKLSSEARAYPYREGEANDQYVSAASLAQGIALDYGRGRLVMVSEAAALTSVAPLENGKRFHFGMSHPDCDNRQLALNIMHWLSRAIH